MDLATFTQLLTSQGQRALAMAGELQPREADFLKHYDQLRKRFPADLAKAALEMALWRRQAARKFTRAGEMYFTREALEQATSESVARHRARRLAGYACVGDGGCGIGGDALALGQQVPSVIAVERDPLRAAMARENVRIHGLDQCVSVREGDFLDGVLRDCDAVFVDPARREQQRRFVSLEHYQPTPMEVRSHFPKAFPLVMKLAPAVPWEELDRLEGEIEFVSLDGELKECIWWSAPLAKARRRATVLPAGESLVADLPAPPVPIQPPQQYVYDPDPAITRAGLVTNLAERLGAAMLDPMLAFLTTEQRVESPFAVCYRVLEWLPFHARKLGDVLKQRDVGRVILVKRGSAVDVNMLAKKWKLTGSGHLFVILTQHRAQPIAILADRIAGPEHAVSE